MMNAESFDQLPDEQKAMSHFTVWRLEEVTNKKGERRLTKVPYIADRAAYDDRTARKASSTNPRNWTSFAMAVATYKQGGWDGIGFMFEGSGYTGGDVDHCIDPETGIIDQRGRRVIDHLQSYTERSFSGDGIHTIIKASMPGTGRRFGPVEFYSDGRYFAMTGQHIPATPLTIEARQDELNSLIAELDADWKVETRLKKDAVLLKLWNGDTSAYDGDASRADLALCSKLAFLCSRNKEQIDRLFRSSKLYRDKWERQDYRDSTIGKAIEAKGSDLTFGLTKNGVPLGSDHAKKATQEAGSQAESKPDLYDLGLAFANHYGEHTTYNEDTAAWSLYTGTHWQELPRGTTKLRDMATAVIRDSGQPVSSINKVEGVIQMAASHCKRTLTPRPNLVNFQNGTLELETMTLRAHSPADGLTFCLPYEYRPGPHPLIDTLLKETIADPIARDAFCALVGAAAIRDFLLQYAGLLLGPLRSGKSTLRQIANLVCGNDRYACAGPELFGRELEGMRSRAAHNNQLLVTLEELPVEALRNEEQFKAMTAHGGVAQRRLHQPEITNNQWRPKLLMVTNEAPRYSDRSGALTDRLIIINCPNSRPEGKRDLYLLDKLLPEIGAFAVTCIQKAKEALKAGHYPQSPAMRAARDDIERNGDAMKSFVSEECVIEAESWIDTANLYQAYRTYCDENGQKAMSKNRFTQALGEKYRTLEPKSKRMPKPAGGTTLTDAKTRGIQGIRLRTPTDPDDEPDDSGTPGVHLGTPRVHLNGETCTQDLSHREATNAASGTPGTPLSIFLEQTSEEECVDTARSSMEYIKEKVSPDQVYPGVPIGTNTASQSHETRVHLNGETCTAGVPKMIQVYPPPTLTLEDHYAYVDKALDGSARDIQRGLRYMEAHPTVDWSEQLAKAEALEAQS